MPSRSFSSVHLVAFLLAYAIQSHAASVMVTAVNNGTIQAAGPRTGSNGKTFFNVEGTNNGQFASYGIADFQIPAGQTPLVANTIVLSLTQANAAFTHNGAVSFYMTMDTAASIDPGTSPYKFPTPAPALSFTLGSGTFIEGSDGTVNDYAFSLTGTLQTYIETQISSGGTLRVVIEPSDPDVAATWAGATFDPSSQRPQLTLTDLVESVPEPSSLLLALGGLSLLGIETVRRTKR